MIDTLFGFLALAIAVALFVAVEYFGARLRGEDDDEDARQLPWRDALREALPWAILLALGMALLWLIQ